MEHFDLRAELVTIKEKLECCIEFMEQGEPHFSDNLGNIKECRVVIGSLIQEIDIKKAPNE